MSILADAQALYKSGRFDEAERTARELLARDPDNADAMNVVGMSCLMTGRWGDALAMLARVVHQKPNYANARANLAFLLLHQRKFAEAEEHARCAIELAPALAVAHVTLGRALAEQGRKGDGAASLHRALGLDPNNIDALYWLAFIADDAQRYDVAADFAARALAIKSDHLPSIYLLALAQHKQGLLDDAIETYARGVQIAPHDAAVHSNLLIAKMYHPAVSPRELLDDLREWARRHANFEAKEIVARDFDARPDRPLRIGYVSPYFHEHSVAFFVEPILAHHDREKFSIVVYSDVAHADAVTARCKALASEWRDTLELDDAALAELVRKDRVDILVDLTQHTGGSRLRAFARRPAPVQVAYLGCPNTTGLPAIDYRLSDGFLDPVVGERFSSEKVVRLPRSYFCYRPPDDAPPIAPDPPCARKGHITFVSQNALAKLNEPCVATWAAAMHAVANSRLIIKAAGCASQSARTRYLAMLQAHGIESARVEFRNHTSLRHLMAELNDADIALDTFPYNGGTTTCHILWMGVPVVSIAGEMPVHRLGLSVLSQVGLADLVAKDADEFVRIVRQLASDAARLRDLRANLRQRMRSSPLMDAGRFTRDLESAYREMWRSWCGGSRGNL